MSNVASDMLRLILERIERLEEERAALAGDITDIKREAKAAGFDSKVVGQMLRERRMDASQRQEWLAMCELYRAALGMLDGTPLGEAARRRMTGEPAPTPPPPPPARGKPKKGAPTDDTAAPAGTAPDDAPPAEPPTAAALTQIELEVARTVGAMAARAGEKVTDNPYLFSDPRRAAWDEGWCGSAGSDGMEIPAAFRRKPPEKPTDDKPAGDTPGAGPPQPPKSRKRGGKGAKQ